MANYCYFNMRVRGTKEAIEEFEKIMDYEYYDQETDKETGPCFYRLFHFDMYSELVDDNGIVTCEYSGNCAWSVHVSMCGASLYAKNNKNITTLQKESERLNLYIQVLSQEPGMAFSEYYEYDCGVEIANVDGEFQLLCPYCYENLEECNEDINRINKQCDTNYSLLTQKEFDNYCKTCEDYIEYNELEDMFNMYPKNNLCSIINK